MHPQGDVLDMSMQEETHGNTEDMLERIFLVTVSGTPQGFSDCGVESLGLHVETTWTQIGS